MVRDVSRRHGSVFYLTSTKGFNDFIEMVDLVDIPMTGKRYTRVDSVGAKLSILDRFLLLDQLSDVFPQLNDVVLDEIWSDH